MKLEKQEKVVKFMIKLYCKKKHNHKKGLCPACLELSEYVSMRTSKCPHKENKPFCSTCSIQCYNNEMQEKIKSVMRFSGPRLIFYHPIIAIKHVHSTIKFKKLKKDQNDK